MIDVCAAIICKQDKVLIAKRADNKSLGGKWEFPGGKLEEGEAPDECLKRELIEELDIVVSVGDFFMENIHAYPKVTVRLFAYFAEYVSGDVKLIDHSEIRWVNIEELVKYDFTEADIPFIEQLIRREEIKDGI